MKRVVVVLTASLALALAACAVDKPVEVSAPRAEVKERGVSSDDSVRDAKEAADEAARKIVVATREAANLIKEVSLGAVQSVRDSANRSNDDFGSEELAAKDERVD